MPDRARAIAWTVWILITLWGAWFFFDNWIPTMACGDPCPRDYFDRSPPRYVLMTAAFVCACLGVDAAERRDTGSRRALIWTAVAAAAFAGLLLTLGQIFPDEPELPLNLE